MKGNTSRRIAVLLECTAVFVAKIFGAIFHVLNLPAPATGEVRLLWARAMPTFVAGLFFGYLRDRTCGGRRG
jgi:hypothetical protein